jgi:hypothetical protein
MTLFQVCLDFGGELIFIQFFVWRMCYFVILKFIFDVQLVYEWINNLGCVWRNNLMKC